MAGGNFGGGFVSPENALVLQPGQDLILRNEAGEELIRLDANGGTIRLRNGSLETVIQLQGASGNLLVGGPGSDGDLFLYPQSAASQQTADATIHLNADGPAVRVGQPEKPGIVHIVGSGEQVTINGADGSVIVSGRIDVRTPSGQLRARLGEDGRALLGGGDADGRIELRQADGTTTIVINGETGNLGLGAVAGGNAGALFIKDGSGSNSFVLNGGTAEARIGRNGNAGLLALRDNTGNESIILNGAEGNMALGRPGAPGFFTLHDGVGGESIVMNAKDGNLALGRFGMAGDLFVTNNTGQNTIHLSGNTGNLNLSGDVRFTNDVADCAEEFTLAVPGTVEPGTVLIIGEDGKLAETDQAYDTRAAGVVSGAGHLRPGIVLGADAQADTGTRCLLAMVGRVFVRADADHGAIRIGDLLTTSPTPGHAMRVAERSRAAGAVIGKALAPLQTGRGLVEMLVSLQ